MTISILTTVYNNASEIRNAINSVLSQTYSNIEYIVIDGNSSDGTREIVQSYGNRISRFVSEPDSGMYDALNKGLKMAGGDIIGILHSDDEFNHPDILAAIAGVFEKTGCDAVYGDLVYVSKTDTRQVLRYWKSNPFDVKKFRYGWMPAHPTLFMKKEVYEKYGGFDLRYKIAADYDLMLRTVGSGNLHCEYLPEVITRMRMGGASNKSVKNIWQKTCDDWRAIRHNKAGGPLTLFLKNITKVEQFFRKG
jgi:glycosyltransferase